MVRCLALLLLMVLPLIAFGNLVVVPASNLVVVKLPCASSVK